MMYCKFIPFKNNFFPDGWVLGSCLAKRKSSQELHCPDQLLHPMISTNDGLPARGATRQPRSAARTHRVAREALKNLLWRDHLLSADWALKLLAPSLSLNNLVLVLVL